MANAGEGKCYQWLQDHLGYDGDYCLIWPFNRNPNGYGQLQYLGRSGYAHRMMCELVNGPPPSPDHEAAHSCGNGAGGCAHPKHLSWKTRSENLLDCREHGTHSRNTYGSMGRLSPEQVQEIRHLKGKKTQAEIAAIYKELGALRKYNFSEIARAIGRDSGSVTRRAKALGVISAYDGVPPPRAITPGQ